MVLSQPHLFDLCFAPALSAKNILNKEQFPPKSPHQKVAISCPQVEDTPIDHSQLLIVLQQEEICNLVKKQDE
jgi:hypothetical protein